MLIVLRHGDEKVYSLDLSITGIYSVAKTSQDPFRQVLSLQFRL